MLAPKSWLEKFVQITFETKKLAERLTEVGLNTEKIEKTKDDIIFDIEITPNRPDLLSVIGVAREIAAIEGKQVTEPKLKTTLKPSGKTLPMTIKTDAVINPRFTAIIIDDITVKESPAWLKEKLEKIGQRSINNIVDITNYVMYEFGNPIHAFDYNKIAGHKMTVSQANGGEIFKSVDNLTYHLPKGAVIIKDKENIIDLCGIKGGFNSGTFNETKTILIRVPVEVPILIRRTSQALALRSDASSIFERAVNAGGTVDTLKRCVDLVLELAGGHIASDLFDYKKLPFTPWHVTLRLERLNKILGIVIPEKEVIKILSSLNLTPILRDSGQARMTTIQCTIPTYRNDLKIEEDIVEEIARIYGYNNFPKTLPEGAIPTTNVPYFKNYTPDIKAKEILTASGFSEVYTYSLVSEQDVESVDIDSQNVLRIDNPVSRDFEYLRPTLQINLVKALSQNKAFFKGVNLFELGKVYQGKTLDKAQETYALSGITNQKNFYEVKGILEKIFETLGIKKDPTECIIIEDEYVFFEIPYTLLLKEGTVEKIYVPLPKYPPIVEDISVVTEKDVPTGDLITLMKKQSTIIQTVTLLDQYENSRTFHIIYQDKNKNLTSDEVVTIREKILEALKTKYNALLKD